MRFTDTDPTLDSYWRAIILFGRNVASYKFALANALLEIAPEERELVKLDELAKPFSRHLCAHLLQTDTQGTSGASKFLDQCRAFNRGEISENELIEATVRRGFNNVIDAFHVVAGAETPERFFIDERRESGGIRVTDRLFELLDLAQASNLQHEVEARWRLVETAWELGISKQLIAVQADHTGQELYVNAPARRVSVTSARPALSGYQRGNCFYCGSFISADASHTGAGDIDHFFPHILEAQGLARGLNGVWNLVLACTECNRGPGGKFDRVPDLDPFLYRLEARNNYLIESHHPLRETLIQQTGKTREVRHRFLQHQYHQARALLVHTWRPKESPVGIAL